MHPNWICQAILLTVGLLLLPSLSAEIECEGNVEFNGQPDEPWFDFGEERAIKHLIACDRESILATAEVLRDQGHRVRISALVLKAGLPDGEMVREYEEYPVTINPACNDFASGGGSRHFSWSELNGGFDDGNPHRP